MSILTSDHISGWYILKDSFIDTHRFLIKNLSHNLSIAVRPQNAIQGDAGTNIIDVGEEVNKLSLSGEALIFTKSSTNPKNYHIVSDENTYELFDIFDIVYHDYKKILNFFLISPELLREVLNIFFSYIVLINSTRTINVLSKTQIRNLFDADVYSLSFPNDPRTNSTPIGATTEFLKIVQSFVSTSHPNSNIIFSNAAYVFDTIQIFKETLYKYPNYTDSLFDFYYSNIATNEEMLNVMNFNLDYTNDNLLTLNNKNLIEQFEITIGDEISCTAEYYCNLVDKFNIEYMPDKFISLNNSINFADVYDDFIARVAKNYDCRFYLDGKEYKIKSGSLSVKIDYQQIYCANTFSRKPFYSPQSHTVSGSLKIIIPLNDIEFSDSQAFYNSNKILDLQANCSLVIGGRYFEFGQASVKSSYDRAFRSEEVQTLNVNFTAYSRAGAGIYSLFSKTNPNGNIWQTFMAKNKYIY